MIGPEQEIVAALRQLASVRKGAELVRCHIHAPDVHLYVRICTRGLKGRALQTLVLADINVVPARQRQGVFSALLQCLEKEALTLGLSALLVENIISRPLDQFLRRQGYIESTPHTLYKELGQ